MSKPSRVFSCFIVFVVSSSVAQVRCFASAILDEFSTFPFEERVDFSQVAIGHVDIVVRQNVGAFQRNVALGSVVAAPLDGSAFVGVSGPDASEFYAYTDGFAETFWLYWSASQPFSLGADTTALAFEFGDVIFPDPTRSFRLSLSSNGVSQVIAERSFGDVTSGSTWQVDLTGISKLGMDLTSVDAVQVGASSLARGSSFSIRQVRLVPEPCSVTLVVPAIALRALLGCRIRR